MFRHGIAYTDNGCPPPSGLIVRWKMKGIVVMLWDNRNDALEACDLDGWRGYVCQYPHGERPPYKDVFKIGE
jgi:hypothetical protein